LSDKPVGLEENDMSGNTANYGDDFSSFPVTLALIDVSDSSTTTAPDPTAETNDDDS
jgi:hypothetical protein